MVFNLYWPGASLQRTYSMIIPRKGKKFSEVKVTSVEGVSKILVLLLTISYFKEK